MMNTRNEENTFQGLTGDIVVRHEATLHELAMQIASLEHRISVLEEYVMNGWSV